MCIPYCILSIIGIYLVLFILILYLCFLCFRYINENGLSPIYRACPITRAMFRKFMALPVLPLHHIRPVFEYFALSCPYPAFVSYVRDTYITGTVFSPCVSVYGLDTRTNNDVEGWHTQINGKAQRGKLLIFM